MRSGANADDEITFISVLNRDVPDRDFYYLARPDNTGYRIVT